MNNAGESIIIKKTAAVNKTTAEITEIWEISVNYFKKIIFFVLVISPAVRR